MNKPLASKLYKTNLLAKEPSLQAFLPVLHPFHNTQALSILNTYSTAYVKPEYGTGGKNILKITRQQKNTQTNPTYRVDYARHKSKIFPNHHHLFTWIKSYFTQGKRYVIQQGIPLLHHKGRPFDSRFMVQCNPIGHMDITGWVGRVAADGRIVTNKTRGGSLHPIENLFLTRGVTAKRYEKILQSTKKIVQLASNTFHKYHPRVRELGFDIGWDGHYHPWILEVNTRPHISPFGEFDKGMLNRFYHYRKNYPTPILIAKRGAKIPKPSTRNIHSSPGSTKNVAHRTPSASPILA